MKKILSLIIVVTLIVGVFGATNADASVAAAFYRVKATYGKKFPPTKNVARKDFFGRYSKILGVSTNKLKVYRFAQKFKGKSKKLERTCVIVQAKKKKQVKGIKKKFRQYIKSHKRNAARGYYTKKGRRILNKACVGSKGKFVYLFMLDASGNKKAKSIFRRKA